MVDDVPAVNASQSKDSASSLIDDLGHSQTSTAGALHNLSLVIRLTIKRNSICGAEYLTDVTGTLRMSNGSWNCGRLHTDETTQKARNIQPGDRTEGKVNDQNYVLSILSQ